MSNEIDIFIKEFNDSWTMGEVENIGPLLNENVVFITSDLKSEIKGKDNCVQTIIDYVNSGETKLFKVTEKKIHIWTQTAMIAINYYVEYEMKGKHHKENGKEFWTLIKNKGKWQLVWRAMVMNEKIE